MEELEPSDTAGGGVKCTRILENSLALSFKLKIHLPSNATILLLGIYT